MLYSSNAQFIWYYGLNSPTNKKQNVKQGDCSMFYNINLYMSNHASSFLSFQSFLSAQSSRVFLILV